MSSNNVSHRSPGRPRLHEDTIDAKKAAAAKRQAEKRRRDEESGYKEVRGIRGTTEERELLNELKERLGYKSVKEMIFVEFKNIADQFGLCYTQTNVKKEHETLISDYHYIINTYGVVSNEALIAEQFESLVETPLVVLSCSALKKRILSLFQDGYKSNEGIKYLPSDDPAIIDIADRYDIII